MCEFCESQDLAHSLDHAFLKIRRPEADPIYKIPINEEQLIVAVVDPDEQIRQFFNNNDISVLNNADVEEVKKDDLFKMPEISTPDVYIAPQVDEVPSFAMVSLKESAKQETFQPQPQKEEPMIIHQKV